MLKHPIALTLKDNVSMNIYPSTQVRPYVYFGIDPVTAEFYIGYRKNNKTPSHIDLFNYRTSSKAVKPRFDQMNWVVLAEFENGDDAYDFEQLLIYENWDNALLLNKTCYYGKARFRCSGHTEKTKAKMCISQQNVSEEIKIKKAIATSTAMKNKTKSKKHCKNISDSKLGKRRIPFTEEHVQNMKTARNKNPSRPGAAKKAFGKLAEPGGGSGRNNPFYNHKHSEKSLDLMRYAAKNREIKTCEHCGITVDSANYGRWHGKNCRSLKY